MPYEVYTAPLEGELVGSWDKFKEAEEEARRISTESLNVVTTIVDDEGIVRGRYLNGSRIKDSGMPVY